MKQRLRFLMTLVAVLLIGAAMLTSCNREEETPDVNEIPDFSIPELAGTSWSGRYMDVLNHNGQHQMLFRWTVDFNAEGKGIVMMEVSSPAIEEIVDEFQMTYTYDGSSKGEINYTGYDYEYRSDFVVDPMNRTMDVNLWMHFYLSEDDEEPVRFGGQTTLYKVEK